MSRLNPRLRPALTGTAVVLLVLGLTACQEKTDAPAPAAAAPAAAAGESEHRADGAQTPEEARAQGHREGMEMERDAHERGMEMGATTHADGMKSKRDDAMPMKKADPPMKMDGHM